MSSLPDPDQEVPRVNGLAAAILGTSEVTLFENLYVAYAAEARGIARAILGDNELAADAVHNGFLEMLRYLVAGRRWYDPGDARGMVLRNVRWAALKAHRSRSRLSLGVESAPAGGDDVMWARAEARALCEQIVGQLRPSHQDVLRLRYVEGLSNIEAARQLGVSVDIFESRFRRALRAARRVARSTGVIPQIAAFADSARRLLRRHRPASLPNPAPVMKMLATVTAAVGAVYGVAGWIEHGFGRSDASTVHRWVSAVPAAAQLDPIDNSLVLDAVALPSHVVIALARGRGCGCLVLFRSVSDGTSWEAAPGPPVHAVAPRLAVAAGYPADPRIVIDPGAGQAVQASQRFGAPFTVAGSAVPIARGIRHAEACSAAAPSLYCRGQMLASEFGTGDSAPGALLPLANRRVLYLRHLAGVLCSADGGVSWGQRCPP